MDSPVASAIKNSYERLPRQMKVAAQWLLDHPAEVALLSMREQARRAGVPPATLTRLAKRLGFAGFDSLKQIVADTIRDRPGSFTGRAEELLARRELEGEAALIVETIDALQRHLKEIASPASIAALTAASDLLVGAGRIFCLGLRSSFPSAYLMHYIGSLLGSNTVLIDGAGGIANDALRLIGSGDVLLAVTVSPYTRYTVKAAEFAVSRGATIIAITDSELSPLAKLSEILILVPTETPSFIHTMTPAFAATECLVELIAAKRGRAALKALAANEAHLSFFNTYILPTSKIKRG